jgi:uncharacterized protein YqhQ
MALHEEPLDSGLYRRSVARWPFVRGVVLLWEMLVLGSRMMMFAATIAQGQVAGARGAGGATDVPQTSSGARPAERDGMRSRSAIPLQAEAQDSTAVIETPETVSATDPRLVMTLVISLAFAVGLFFLLPLGVVGAAQRWLGTGWLSLAVEGLLRLGLLVGYLALIGRVADVRRVFEYHGAEHKAINALEAGDPLDVAHVRAASKVHTRCGTGFLLIVVVLSIVVFALVGDPPLALRILSRVALVPVIAALAYELMRLGAANYHMGIVRALMAPSLALQGLTTREPDDGQIECAIAALERVLARDGVSALDYVA